MNSTKICKHCKSEIDAKAKICPNCRKKQGSKSTIIIGIIVAIIILGSIGGNTEDEPVSKVETTAKPVETSDTTKVHKKSDTQKAHKKSDANTKEKASKNEFNVGDVVETKKLKVSFISAKDYQSDNEFIQPKEGNKFIRCEFEFNNIGKSDQYVTSFDFECYADDYACEQSYFDDTLSATLSSGKKTKGAVYFEVPKKSNSVIIEYETNFWTENKIKFIVK